MDIEVNNGTGNGIRIRYVPDSVKIETVGQNRFKVVETVSVDVQIDKKAITIVIPEGFQTDLGSVPRIFRPLLSVASAPIPFIIHDFLYSGRCQFGAITRSRADKIMLRLMKIYKTPRWGWQRRLAWLGVRAGGWAAYKGARKKT